jgi:hypothetical protein
MPSEDWLADLDATDHDIDELIEQITVDAYGDEGYWSFRQAFEDHVRFPLPGSVLGVEVSVTAVDFDGDERRGLTAIATRQGRTRSVSLLDIEVPGDQVRFTRLANAYRRWLGVDR